MLHLKNGIAADVPATARIVRDASERRTVLAALIAGMPNGLGARMDLDEMVASAPLVEVTFVDY